MVLFQLKLPQPPFLVLFLMEVSSCYKEVFLPNVASCGLRMGDWIKEKFHCEATFYELALYESE